MWKYLAGDTFQSNDQIGLKPAEQNEFKVEKKCIGEITTKNNKKDKKRN